MSMTALYLIRQIIRLLVEVKQASVLTRPSSKNKYLLRLCFQSEKDKIVSLHTGVPKFLGVSCPSLVTLSLTSGTSAGGENLSQWNWTQRSLTWNRVDADLKADRWSIDHPISTTPSLCVRLWNPGFASSSAKWISLCLPQSLKGESQHILVGKGSKTGLGPNLAFAIVLLNGI